MSHKRFIAFFGPDGVGKTTHVHLLIKTLESKGLKVKKVWIRSPHTLAFIVSMFLLRSGFYRESSTLVPITRVSTQTLKSHGEGKFVQPWDVRANPWRDVRIEDENTLRIIEKIPAIDSSPNLRSLWPFLELVSVLPLILWRVSIPLFLGYTLVAERYVVDTIVTIGYFVNDSSFLTSRIARLLLKFIPRGSLLIHLDSDYDTLVRRRGHNVEVRQYINFQKIGYAHFDRLLKPIIIDTSKSGPKQTFITIMKNLEKSGKCIPID